MAKPTGRGAQHAHSGQVTEFDDDRSRLRLYVQPAHPLTNDNVVAMHKLMIEGNEREHLTSANRVPAIAAKTLRVRRPCLDLPFIS